MPAYCSNANVYLASNMGRGGGSASSVSYATIGSFQKLPLTPASSVFPTVSLLLYSIDLTLRPQSMTSLKPFRIRSVPFSRES